MWTLVLIILVVLAIWICIKGISGLKNVLKLFVGQSNTYQKSQAYHNNIEQSTLRNENYRKVEYTTPNMQLVLMNLPPGQEIGLETHSDTTQFIRVEKGTGKAIIDKKEYALSDGMAVVIQPGVEHNIIATTALKLYTLYSPPEHPDGLIQPSKV